MLLTQGQHYRNASKVLTTPGYDFGRCFFLLLVRLLRNWKARGSQLPFTGRVNQRKAPPPAPLALTNRKPAGEAQETAVPGRPLAYLLLPGYPALACGFHARNIARIASIT